MPSFSRGRLISYAVIITALVSLLAFGDNGVLSGVSLKDIKVFKAPRDLSVVSLQLDESDVGRGKEASPRGDSASNTAKDEFDFSGELNRLSSSDGSAGDLDSVARQIAASGTPAPNVIPLSADNDRLNASDALNDGRQNFAGLEGSNSSAGGDQGILAGVTVRSNSLGMGTVILTPQVTPTDTRVWVGGQARGYAMLYAMQPEARQVVETQVQNLLAARIREPYIGVLIDGTFGQDFAYLKDILRRLSIEDRALTLVLYLSNGPTMRKSRETPIEALFARIPPAEFRQRIRRDQFLRNQFLAVAVQAKDVFTYNLSLGADNSNIAIVMLEDNLDFAAYRSMRELASQQLEGLAGFVRNPCVGCFDGNDDVTLGDPREEHKMERFSILRRGDGFSLDGTGFQYPNLGGDLGVSANELSSLMLTSFQRGLRYVGLWRHAWQGVSKDGSNLPPEDRAFVPSTPDQQEFEIQTLRTGLIPESFEDANVQ